ncbi:hypothetical protein ACOSQ4_001653 [Xanthoceras sorbifolium]
MRERIFIFLFFLTTSHHLSSQLLRGKKLFLPSTTSEFQTPFEDLYSSIAEQETLKEKKNKWISTLPRGIQQCKKKVTKIFNITVSSFLLNSLLIVYFFRMCMFVCLLKYCCV